MDFGITPSQLAEVVALWRRCGRQLDGLSLSGGELTGSGSLAVTAVNECRRATRETCAARARQLDALASALARFGALTEEADAAAAAALADRRRS
ncbi:hypothetical protein [Gordonia phthalatica]|uniref:Uncharacterized protein n=1 Tax=Gordonia phthalatica TaxID=1136941 RepID=A0A0N9N964_9ACTN|nr:hypothetical protein [Gordonia phthalatica]ALG83907.1 hypothetical protein ACH46_04490 [Gordonia phthalatica]